MEIVIDESELVQDFVSEIPAECLTFLNGIGFNTLGLLTADEISFRTSLTSFPNIWGADQLWTWIQNWRRRNNLENIVLTPEDVDDTLEADEAAIDANTFYEIIMSICLRVLKVI